MNDRMWLKSSTLIAALLLLVACDKVNRANYDKLELRMKYSEVTQLLGEPTECDELIKLKQCVWGSKEKGAKNITVNFIDDTVMLYSNSGLE